MNTQCSILCEDVLAPLAGGEEVNICPIIAHAALDIICETAMGRNINAQKCSDNVRAVYEATELVAYRSWAPWIRNDWAFALSPTGAR
jgi:hypothetical protein